MEPIYYVGIIAQLLTYASFLSGAKVCHLIYKQQSCARLSAAPFLAGLNCSALWLRYGLLADEWEIIAVNSVGLVFSLIYLGFFVYYSRQKGRLLKQMISLILFLLFLLWSIQHSVDANFYCGSLASMSSLVACAAPLATLQDVLKTKCVASMPLPIIASSFVVTLSWLIFGILKGDSFIVFSNVVAVSINAALLTLFLIYPSILPYEKLSQSNKKSYDLIRLMNGFDDEDEEFEENEEDDELTGAEDSSWLAEKEIDTEIDYKQILAKIMGQIYSKREKMISKSPPPPPEIKTNLSMASANAATAATDSAGTVTLLYGGPKSAAHNEAASH